MKTVIATRTLYPDKENIRLELAQRMIVSARENGITICVVDQSPDPEISKTFIRLGAIATWNENPTTMGKAWRQAILKARGLAGSEGAIALIEPEKHTIIPLLAQAVDFLRVSGAGLLIPKRASLTSYPSFQQKFEELGNYAFYLLTGKAFDVWFGPRIFSADIAPYFLNYDGEYGDKWDATFIPILRLMAAGTKIAGLEVDYRHPESQTANEGGYDMFLKRMEQLTFLVRAIETEAVKLGLYKPK